MPTAYARCLTGNVYNLPRCARGGYWMNMSNTLRASPAKVVKLKSFSRALVTCSNSSRSLGCSCIPRRACEVRLPASHDQAFGNPRHSCYMFANSCMQSCMEQAQVCGEAHAVETSSKLCLRSRQRYLGGIGMSTAQLSQMTRGCSCHLIVCNETG